MSTRAEGMNTTSEEEGRAKGVLQALLHVLQYKDLTPAICESACAELLKIATEEADLRAELVQADGVGTIIRAISTVNMRQSLNGGQAGLLPQPTCNALLACFVNDGHHDNIIKGGKTALHWAAQFGEEKALRFVLESCPLVNIKDGLGNTPLHLAALNDHLTAAKLLLLRNADVLQPNNAGSTPRDVAPFGSATSALLEEEAAWRRYLQQPKPCTVREGGSLSSLLGIVVPLGSATVRFDALSGLLCLQTTSPSLPSRHPCAPWLRCGSKRGLEVVENQVVALPLPHTVRISTPDSITVDLDFSAHDDFLGEDVYPPAPVKGISIGLTYSTEMARALRMMLQRAHRDVFRVRRALSAAAATSPFEDIATTGNNVRQDGVRSKASKALAIVELALHREKLRAACAVAGEDKSGTGAGSGSHTNNGSVLWRYRKAILKLMTRDSGLAAPACPGLVEKDCRNSLRKCTIGDDSFPRDMSPARTVDFHDTPQVDCGKGQNEEDLDAEIMTETKRLEVLADLESLRVSAVSRARVLAKNAIGRASSFSSTLPIYMDSKHKNGFNTWKSEANFTDHSPLITRFSAASSLLPEGIDTPDACDPSPRRLLFSTPMSGPMGTPRSPAGDPAPQIAATLGSAHLEQSAGTPGGSRQDEGHHHPKGLPEPKTEFFGLEKELPGIEPETFVWCDVPPPSHLRRASTVSFTASDLLSPKGEEGLGSRESSSLASLWKGSQGWGWPVSLGEAEGAGLSTPESSTTYESLVNQASILKTNPHSRDWNDAAATFLCVRSANSSSSSSKASNAPSKPPSKSRFSSKQPSFQEPTSVSHRFPNLQPIRLVLDSCIEAIEAPSGTVQASTPQVHGTSSTPPCSRERSLKPRGKQNPEGGSSSSSSSSITGLQQSLMPTETEAGLGSHREEMRTSRIAENHGPGLETGALGGTATLYRCAVSKEAKLGNAEPEEGPRDIREGPGSSLREGRHHRRVSDDCGITLFEWEVSGGRGPGAPGTPPESGRLIVEARESRDHRMQASRGAQGPGLPREMPHSHSPAPSLGTTSPLASVTFSPSPHRNSCMPTPTMLPDLDAAVTPVPATRAAYPERITLVGISPILGPPGDISPCPQGTLAPAPTPLGFVPLQAMPLEATPLQACIPTGWDLSTHAAGAVGGCPSPAGRTRSERLQGDSWQTPPSSPGVGQLVRPGEAPEQWWSPSAASGSHQRSSSETSSVHSSGTASSRQSLRCSNLLISGAIKRASGRIAQVLAGGSTHLAVPSQEKLPWFETCNQKHGRISLVTVRSLPRPAVVM